MQYIAMENIAGSRVRVFDRKNINELLKNCPIC